MSSSTTPSDGTPQNPTSLDMVGSPVVMETMSIFDMPTEEYVAQLDRRIENRNIFMKWVNSELVEKIDYDYIGFGGGKATKPTLLKPGAEKICAVAGVVAKFPNLGKYEEMAMSGSELNMMVIRCLLIKDGKIVGEGAGGRSMKQDRFDLNKYLKMCVKSSYIDAVIRTFGIGALFTQDAEDVAEEVKKKEAIKKREVKIKNPKMTDKQLDKIKNFRKKMDDKDKKTLDNYLKKDIDTFRADELIINLKMKLDLIKENKKAEIIATIPEVTENDRATKKEIESLITSGKENWMTDLGATKKILLEKCKKIGLNKLESLSANQCKSLIAGIEASQITPFD